MFVGGTGCGKTTLFYHFVKQIKSSLSKDDVIIIFDSKGDFHKKFYNKSTDLILGNSSQYKNDSVKWNIFSEILSDGSENENISQNAQEICRSLFAERTEGNNSNPFFPNAARDLLSSLLTFYIREGKRDSKNGGDFAKNSFYNSKFKEYLDISSIDDFINDLRIYNDLNSVSSYINGDGGQSQGVVSEMYSITRDIFTGVFADSGLFSMREFVRNKGAKTLFVEYDLAIGSVLGPIYSLLFDLALKEALGRAEAKGNIYFIIDELKLLPHLQHLDDGINFGRSLGVKILVGLQNIKQLEAAYETARARNIIYGFSSVFAFRSNDPETRKYASELFGKNLVLEEYQGYDMLSKEDKRDGNVVEDWDLTSLVLGEAIVGLTSQKPFRFKFDDYK
jgi:type IV secretory pathway TraG/TraD family ATPase VirD4